MAENDEKVKKTPKTTKTQHKKEKEQVVTEKQPEIPESKNEIKIDKSEQKLNPLPEKDVEDYTPKYTEDSKFDSNSKIKGLDDDDVVVGGVLVDQEVLKTTRADKSERRKSIIMYIIIVLLILTWLFIGFMYYQYKKITEQSQGNGNIILEGEGEDGSLDFAVYTAKYDDEGNPTSYQRLTQWDMPVGIQGGVLYYLNLWVENLDDTEVTFRIWVQLKMNDTVLSEHIMYDINSTNFTKTEDANIMYYYYKNDATNDTLAPNEKVSFADVMWIDNTYTSINRHNCFINIYVELYSGQHDWNAV